MTIKGKRILVVGASSDMAFSLNGMLIKGGASVGLHYNKNASALKEYEENSRIKNFRKIWTQVLFVTTLWTSLLRGREA